MKLTPHNEDRIIFIEGSGNYSMIHWLGRPAVCESRTVKYFVSMLSSNFIRIHKSYLINKIHIKSVDQIKQRVIMEGGKELQVSKRQWPVVQNELSRAPAPINFEDLKKLMHYFGWSYENTSRGIWEFWNKSMPGNYCGIKPIYAGSFIAKVEFNFIGGGNVIKQDVAKVKKLEGLCNAIRNHTKSLIYRREVLLQVGQTAA